MILSDNKLQVSGNNLVIELKENVDEIMKRQHIKNEKKLKKTFEKNFQK